MEYVYVYRIDHKTRTEIPLGVIFERRKEERGFNYLGMLHFARKEFAETTTDIKTIFISYYQYPQYS
jgi:hypothetical protein